MGVREQYEARKEAYQRRAQESAPKPWWWLGQGDAIARFNKWLVLWTALLFVGTAVSAAILWKTESTLRETMVANERPWLKMTIEPDSDFSYLPDLGIQFLVKINLTNIGKSPALYVTAAAKLTTIGLFDTRSSEIKNDVCDEAKGASSADVGYVVFPNDAVQIIRPVFVMAEEASLFFKSVVPNSNPPRYILRDAAVIICAGYKTAYSGEKVHKTGTIARLSQHLPNGFDTLGLIMSGSNIPQNEIRINRGLSFVGDEAD